MIGDTLIRPLVKTDRPATFYYLIAPTGTVDEPTPEGIMDGRYKPQGGVSGTFIIPSGNTEYQLRIEGLKPEQKYIMYCFLKGTPAATSKMEEIPFEMTDVESPKLTAKVVRRYETSAEIEIESDIEADVDWIVYDRASEPAEITADYIRNKQETVDIRPIDSGGPVRVSIKKDATSAKETITIEGLERYVYYNFYAVAKSVAGGDDSFVSIKNITPVDTAGPTVELTTQITGETEGPRPTYTGTVTLIFSEPMFYIPSEEEDLKPLTPQIFTQALKGSSGGTYTLGKRQSVPVKDGNALINIEINFSGVSNGSVIYIPYGLSDSNSNIAGKLSMVFVPGQGGTDPYWEHKFVR